MKKAFQDNTLLKWWWTTVDRWILFATLILIGIGTWLVTSASPAIALQHKWSPFILAKKHLFMLIPGIMLMFGTSFLGKRKILIGALCIFVLAWCATWTTLFAGQSIKGARRWISLGSFSLQPSEFVKPAIAIIFADILSRKKNFVFTGGLLIIALTPIIAQPDLGMSTLISMTWFVQCFVIGLSWVWIGALFLLALCLLLLAYFLFPHVAQRFHTFFATNQDVFGAQYQNIQAIKSFRSGGWFGKGIGSGIVTSYLPDGHADFILAVAGEELGLLACIIIILLYFVVFFRGFYHTIYEFDPFYALSTTGLTMQMTGQVLLNVGSVLGAIPTKGTTLPFLSYGGSSFLAMCWTIGMLLALTRKFRALVDV